jgi:hypothetical protein
MSSPIAPSSPRGASLLQFRPLPISPKVHHLVHSPRCATYPRAWLGRPDIGSEDFSFQGRTSGSACTRQVAAVMAARSGITCAGRKQTTPRPPLSAAGQRRKHCETREEAAIAGVRVEECCDHTPVTAPHGKVVSAGWAAALSRFTASRSLLAHSLDMFNNNPPNSS